MENKEIMDGAQNHRLDEIDIHIDNFRKVEEIKMILAFKDLKKSNLSVTPKVSQSLLDEIGIDIESLINAPPKI